jgi:hypothetical protein
MFLLIGVGLALLCASCLMPTVNLIIADSVRAVGLLVAYYYGLAGLVAAYAARGERAFRWLWLCAFPALSGILLICLAIYAISTFDLVTDAVGIGGLVAGVLFFRPRRFVIASAPLLPNDQISRVPRGRGQVKSRS